MKIERVNDNQIRCILTPGDLIKRHLSIKSIAQGDQAAQALVREMMEQSSEEFGFEPNEFPLLVELSPAEGGGIDHNGEIGVIALPSIHLVKYSTVTKVNSMDEIPISAQADHLMRALQAIVNMAKENDRKERIPAPVAAFSFDARRVLVLPPELKEDPRGVHTALYWQPKYNVYYLCVTSSLKYQAVFSHVCHLLSEYGRSVPVTEGSPAYFAEHYVTLCARNALKHIAAGEVEPPKG